MLKEISLQRDKYDRILRKYQTTVDEITSKDQTIMKLNNELDDIDIRLSH
jgi:hypothetical protein